MRLESAPGAEEPMAARPLDAAASTDAGTERGDNEDHCGLFLENPACVLACVADGVSSSPGGEVASEMAIEGMLRAYREAESALAAGQRLYRAVQQANIEIYDRAIAVPELRGMATTLTALVVDRGELTAVHVGDSRLYLIRSGRALQLTKDHTLAAERSRMGLLGREQARFHADRCVLTRSVGRELIVSRDRTARLLARGDVLMLCTDGLWNVLSDAEMAELVADRDAASACRALIDAANSRGAPDNVTAAVVKFDGPTLEPPPRSGWRARLGRMLLRR